MCDNENDSLSGWRDSSEDILGCQNKKCCKLFILKILGLVSVFLSIFYGKSLSMFLLWNLKQKSSFASLNLYLVKMNSFGNSAISF